MIRVLFARLPQFRVTTLLWATLAVALGFAISQGPLAQQEDSFFAEFENRWAEGLQATGCVLVLYALAGQIRQLFIARKDLPTQFRFDAAMQIAVRLGIACAIAALLVVRLLMNRQLFARLPREEMLQVWSNLWPDVLLSGCLFVALGSLSASVGIRERLGVAGRLVNLAVIAGLTTFTAWMLVDRATITALVHIATESIELSTAQWLQREGAFPNHRAEGYQTFWTATGAAAAVVAAFGLLYAAARIKRRGDPIACWSVFTLVVAGLAAYVWWFGNYEAPRLNPDFAYVPTPRLWSDTLAGWLLLSGLATALGIRLARGGVVDEASQVLSLPRSGYAVLGGLAIALGETTFLVNYIRYSFSAVWVFTPSNIWEVVQEVCVIVLQAETLIPVMVLLMAVRLLWQAYRKSPPAIRLIRVKSGDVFWSIVASAALLIVAIPTFAAFSVCYWLGPFIVL